MNLAGLWVVLLEAPSFSRTKTMNPFCIVDPFGSLVKPVDPVQDNIFKCIK